MSRARRMAHARLTGMLRKGIVTLSKKVFEGIARVQVEGIDPGDVDDYETYGPPGFLVRPPKDSEVLIAAPAGDADQEVALGFTGRGFAPTTLDDESDIAEGEGGLYYAGTFKVFMGSDGLVYLGADKSDAGHDFVALAAKVLTELNAIKTAFDAHTHPFVATGAASPTSAPTTPMPSPSSVAAAATKAK